MWHEGHYRSTAPLSVDCDRVPRHNAPAVQGDFRRPRTDLSVEGTLQGRVPLTPDNRSYDQRHPKKSMQWSAQPPTYL